MQRKNKEEKICKPTEHEWEHKLTEGENISGDLCLWLTHICIKCGLETTEFPLPIKILKYNIFKK